MKQTAVDYLHSEYKRIFGNVFVDVQKVFETSDNLAKAKEIEKQQIINAFNEGWLQCNISGLPERSREHYETPEQYYNETFNK